MPADRFFLPVEMKPGQMLFLEGPEHHHLAHVMRVGVSEEIELVNGKGALALCRVLAVQKHQTQIHVLSETKNPPFEPSFSLGIPMMRPSKLEWIVEKGTELGAAAFCFYPAEHSEKDELSERQLERLHILAVSALKQSGRLYLPSIEIAADLSRLFKKDASVYFGDTRKAPGLGTSDSSPILFVTGPEKGFSSEEMVLLSQHAKGVSLSPHILRAETAPIAAASILGARQL